MTLSFRSSISQSTALALAAVFVPGLVACTSTVEPTAGHSGSDLSADTTPAATAPTTQTSGCAPTTGDDADAGADADASADEDADVDAGDVDADADAAAGDNLLVGPWTFVSSDIRPDNAYSIDGDTLHLDFEGVFQLPPNTGGGGGAGPFTGYTFEQPVAITLGANYRLTLTVSNDSNGLPTYYGASLSGAGPTQQVWTYGNGVLTVDFAISDDPGANPELVLSAKAPIGQLGPTSSGQGITRFDVTASLVRTN